MVACQSGEICSHATLILITHGARVNGLPNVCALKTLNVVHATTMISSLVCFVQVKDKPLICASARGNTKIVKYLLTYGADINQKDGVINILT